MSEPKGSPRGGPMMILATAAALSALAGFLGVYVTGHGPDNKAADNAAGVPVAAAPAGAVAAPESAKPAAATDGINPLSKGAMTAFVFKKAPEDLPAISFVDGTGKALSLADFKGRTVLLNLWATWCGPCRKEMPALASLQKALGGDRFEVVALSVDRAGIEAARKFLTEVKADGLTLYADASARSVATLKAVGMPTTLLIDKEGREIGRLIGPAEWDSADARALIEAAAK